MIKDPPGVFRHLELLESALRRAGNDRVVVEPHRVQYGDFETMRRFAVSDTSVVEWRGDRGTGALTGTEFESAADAERWIVADASGYLREARGLPIAHWLLDREEELPEGFALHPDGDGIVLRWVASGTEHRARFGGALPKGSALQFSTVARVPIALIESCALAADSRAAFAAAASSAAR
ncbi:MULTISPECIES: hypothetical protein [unclassified Curtobacterium]|uniref:hypothetical protein n=1 Tax=unclassified Curtobacterium TaxID=257496 RepID=UPI000D8CA047|nr:MULTISPECIES: hypothetical protein [unclassified Curtobacterium]PYY63965.1 hypothetical protein DEJ30_10970 [Curtobacterium sp. MCPF17_003]PZF29605.1 hypothetical protein DEJ35_10470 [Curtobacterium sp. MCPF17_051]WIB69735.1 hypothetical protein DEI85_11225 [Curtobacterium sp. MCBD17_026]